MSNFFNEEDLKTLNFFEKYLKSQGVKQGADIELFYSDYFGSFEFDESDIPSHLSNFFRVEIPEMLHPIIMKVVDEAKKKYEKLNFDYELSWEKIELEIDVNDKEVSVYFYSSYFDSESASGVDWSLEEEEPDSILFKIFETLSEISPEQETFKLSYNGGGDSGYIEDSFESGEPVPADIESWCYDQLEREYGGWEINEGSDGNFEFDMVNKRIVLDHTYNIEENIRDILFREKY